MLKVIPETNNFQGLGFYKAVLAGFKESKIKDYIPPSAVKYKYLFIWMLC